jgi:biopolymer transport protein ExbD
VALRGPLPADEREEGGEALFAEVNITPLTDVMLVLLIIFMVSSSALLNEAREGQLDVELPSAGSVVASQPMPEALVVSIVKDGHVNVGGESIADEQLLALLRDRLAENSKQSLVIDADGDLAHRMVVHVIDVARLAGFSDVGFGVMPAR